MGRKRHRHKFVKMDAMVTGPEGMFEVERCSCGERVFYKVNYDPYIGGMLRKSYSGPHIRDVDF